MNRRQFARTMSAAGVAGLGAGMYAWRIEPHWTEFVHRIMPVKNLPEKLVGKTLVHLTDIHVGHQVDDNFIRSVFRDVQSLDPDLVAVTGDFVSHHGSLVILIGTTPRPTILRAVSFSAGVPGSEPR